MLTPAFVNILSFFYPIGNTPAVCLTQDLPSEQNARVLLLGCGDVRHILFTTYADSAAKPRRLDFTCCDIEKAVLARNILLFTLLVDDVDGVNENSIWNIYYHLFLDSHSLEILEAQSKKLHTLAASIENWHGSKYGKLLRFCDRGTIKRVREVWSGYATKDFTHQERVTYDRRFKADILKARDSDALGSFVTTGYRSAAPVGFASLKDLPGLYRHYWDHGITDKDPNAISKAKFPNPMFASQGTDNFTLHYGTDPLLGFHLATAYVPLTTDSPLFGKMSTSSQVNKVVEAAQLQFRVWGNSFRTCIAQNLTIRFFVGEALAFAHTLQHKIGKSGSLSAHWYRDLYHVEPLILDGPDYTEHGKANLSFNVIDTSNLADHVGSLNIMVATSPLLENSPVATLFTESLVRRAENQKASINKMLCGHFPTVSTLLGLFPLEYWTSTTAISTIDESTLNEASNVLNDIGQKKGQLHIRLAWKRQFSEIETPHTMASILFNDGDLAHVLYQVYRDMFQHEDIGRVFSKLNLQTLQNNSLIQYHRGSFASFLRLVKHRVGVQWERVMGNLLDLIENDTTILLGRNYIQELYLQLYLLELYTVKTLNPKILMDSYGRASKGLGAWKEIPAVVYITLRVPRAKLGVFTGLAPRRLGTPFVHCLIQSGMAWQNLFAMVQMAFGKLTTSGSRDCNDFLVHVEEDELGWAGNSPLIVSFCVPSWVVLLDPQNATVAFGVQSTPQASNMFAKTLGVEMNVFSTTIQDEENVKITRYSPNQSGHASICDFESHPLKAVELRKDGTSTTMRANIDRGTTQIVALTARIDFKLEDIKSFLRNQGVVKTVQISPCAIGVLIGDSSVPFRLKFPIPVLQSKSKLRIARKSSYVEIIAPIASPIGETSFTHFMYPLIIHGHAPIAWNMPYLKLDCLPILDTSEAEKIDWLIAHTSLQFSSRERDMRIESMKPRSDAHNDLRTNFKDSLFSMFMHFSGLQGKESRVFAINHPQRGGVHILVFVSCLRLDMANHTVVLDAAVLPLTDRLVPLLQRFLMAISQFGICNIKVNDDELKLWKEVIPAMVERCRMWDHHTTCEYTANHLIPLSVENGQPTLCSCGNGKLPSRFIPDIPYWDMASKYAVRAAISPSFCVSYLEDIFDATSMKMQEDIKRELCQNCLKDKSANGMNLLNCSRCHIAKYCSVDCQRTNWKEHKRVCGKRV